ncbi:hypothetical protein SCNRRL3882_5247 [Streptomyces chartreusis NRRL 3882]|uniref:Uncharacterized protein n=1 Tax=Streptomyces chartreusis NRRL 3882 TaxID=1079985 RepID=A0A2N9BEK0_STRCX|nr:hypothetical protein SCNRRL3882_5247 [Streptomyces chartreusis NRRL 3882]
MPAPVPTRLRGLARIRSYLRALLLIEHSPFISL